MSCGCGKVRDNTLAGRRLKAERDLTLNEYGLYDLASAPGCTEGYSGPFTSATVYVVDRGGPNERYFLRKQWDEAQIYARQHDAGLVHVMAKNLCHEPMMALLHGSEPAAN